MNELPPPFTVAEMAATISQANQNAVPSPVWIDGTLTSWKRGRAWGNGELVSYDYRGKIAAKLRLGVPGRVAAAIETELRHTGVELQAGLNIRVLAKPELHPLYGLRLAVVTIQTDATVSQDRRDYQALLDHIMTSGVGQRQKALNVEPQPGQTLGLITPHSGDAARQDVLAILTKLHITPRELRVPMSGPNALKALPNAFRRLRDTDVILAIRGGGEASDIAVFNHEQVVMAVAASKPPVIVGIGHATDKPLVQHVAHHAATTPTAAAQWVAENFAGIQPAIPNPLPAPEPRPPTPSTPRPHAPLPAATAPPNKRLIAAVVALAVLVVILLVALLITSL